MKKNKFFQIGLYLEGIRQLKLSGIMLLVVFSIEAILVPVGYVVSALSHRYTSSISYEPIAQQVNGLSVHPILIAAFVLAAPIMTMSLFGFLNKRNSSDFYHSLPHTRTGMYVSFMAAIATWLAVIIAGSTLISGTVILIFHRFFVLNVPSLLMLALNCLIASLLVSCVIVTAMSITGTRFNNLILSGLLLFLPRLLITLVCYVLTNSLPLLVTNHIFPLFGDDYNIVTGSVYGVFEYLFGSFFDVSPTLILVSGKAALYTFCLAVVYFAAGCFLFRKRPSESAAIAAPNRKVQALYRISVTMAYCSLVTCVLFKTLISGRGMSSSDLFQFFVFYIIAVLIYFIYELVTTKKWKNLLRALPSLGIVVALNVVLIGCLFGVYHIALNYSPSEEQIKSISILPDDNYRSASTYSFQAYLDQKIGTIQITDPDTIRMISRSLQENVTNIKNKKKPYAGLQERDKAYYEKNGFSPERSFEEITCCIRTAGGVRYRNVYISSLDMQMIVNMLRDNDEIRQLYMTLPECSAQSITVYQQGTSLTQEQLKEVYDIMRYEIAVSDFSVWYNRLHDIDVPATASGSPNLTANRDILCTFAVSVIRNLTTITVRIPLYTDICPQAAAKYRAYATETEQAAVDRVFELLESMQRNEIEYSYYITVDMYDRENSESAYFAMKYNGDNPENDKDVTESLDFLLNTLGRKVDVGENACFAFITIEFLWTRSDIEQTVDTGSYSVQVAIPDGFPTYFPDCIRNFGSIEYIEESEKAG